ncbi:MAG TPA: GyrI-like domain-containing protein [Flavobacterium sp.]|nr:GyrI-like domain-containing protein [Flavobacterium sp.]
MINLTNKEPRIEMLAEKKLVGGKIIMSFSANKTVELWRNFMPRRNEITNTIGTDLYSVQIYSSRFFEAINPNAEFQKWATMEVSDLGQIPDGMEPFTLHSGIYAVFQYKGNPTEADETFKYIFGTWIPASDYVLDDRPHFEILGEKYKNGDPDSEEEIWIPIRPKSNG